MSAKHHMQSELRQALARCRGRLLMTGFFSFFINLLMLSVPLYMLLVYDRVLTSGSLPTLTALSVMVAMLLIVMGGLEFVRSRLLVRTAARLEGPIVDRVFDAAMRRPLLVNRDQDERPLQDLGSFRDFLSGQGPIALFDAPWTPIYLGAIYLLHPLLGYVAIAGAVLLFTIALLNEFTTRRPLGAAAQATAQGRAMADSGLRNVEVLGSMGLLAGLRRRWRQSHGAATDQQRLASDRAGGLTALSKTIRFALQAAILGVGASLAVDQLISPGVMIAASIIMGRALAPVEMAIGSWRPFVAARAAYRRLDRLLREVPSPAERVELPTLQGQLDVINVTAGPPGVPRPVLHNISFALHAGEALGVIGPSGSGKSTLVRLLVGVWQPQHGSLRLDGAKLAHWPAAQRASGIGYLPQDVELFAGSVMENICRFADGPDDQAIVAAACRAGVHDTILQLPEGYETQIGDGGRMLSGGQRQRIALARALYGDPAFVVLDEPNSNLDAVGDMALAHAIREMKARGQTVIVIAHRPSAIAAVDKLLVLDDGHQVAFGDKDEVLAATTRPTRIPGDNVAALATRQAS